MTPEQTELRYGGRLWPDAQKPLPPPPRRPNGHGSRRWTVGILATILIVSAVAIASGPWKDRSGDPTSRAAADGGQPTVEVADPQPSPQEGNIDGSDPGVVEQPATPGAPVEIVGSFNGADTWSVGTELRFGVLWLRYPWPKCYTHTFSSGGRPRGAYYTNCAWDDQKLAFFQLNFKNRSGHSIKLSRLDVTLHTADGRALTPLNIGATKKFLSALHTLGWQSEWNAWVAFDASAGDIHPASMTYEIGDETLVQTFDGSEGVVSPK